MSSAATPMKLPPIAKKVEYVMELFGDIRVDHHYWLRDDSRSNSEIHSHLKKENAYTDSFMCGTKQFEQQLFAEIRGRIKEDDFSAPRRKGPYYYYTRTLEGKEYVQHCRRYISNNEVPPSVHDVMPTGPNDPPEYVILDENVKAQGHEYYSIGVFKVSPNHKLVAYSEDTKGDEIYTVYVIDVETQAPVGKPLTGATSSLEWAGNDFLVYGTMDDIHRADKVWLHKLGTDQSSDSCLYHEKDDKFCVELQASESEKYLFIISDSRNTRFVSYVDVSMPQDGAKVLTPRIDGIDTSVSHRGNHFFIRRRTDELFNSELLACPVDDISATTVLIPNRESIKIWDVQLFADHLAVYERENGLPKITAYHLPAVDEPLKSLKGGRVVDFIDPVYCVDSEESEFSSSILRFSYSSLRTPCSVYEYDMNTGISVLKKIDTVLGGFDLSNYVTERKWATASDGMQIPLSIVYRNDLVKLDGSHPLLLHGYGSYEMSIDPTFKAPRLSLLDRGFIFAIAHVRGGGEMGRQWYENGKLLKKKNTFTDFIACAEYLIEQKYCSKEKLCIEGRSAGGLLIGAVLNMRPDLFKAAVAGVPFLDVLTTMLDPSIPLTTEEWEVPDAFRCWMILVFEFFIFLVYIILLACVIISWFAIFFSCWKILHGALLISFSMVFYQVWTFLCKPSLLKSSNRDGLMTWMWCKALCCFIPGVGMVADLLLLLQEWGDPREEEFYFYIKSYSPVDNVKRQNYPNILVTTGLHDPRVMYSEPAKFVAKLRDMKTDDNVVLFKCDLCAGHSSKSGRFERLREDAFTYTFLMKVLNMIPDLGAGQN